MRIGQGFDAHRFAAGRPLILGGVQIPWELGLAAHSDGDVLIHALCDALLGAAALGDIGRHYPDSDARYRGVDSRELLRDVVARLLRAGWEPGNVDLTLIAQQPKIAPFVEAMRRNLAADLGLAVQAVNVKGTTTETMGFAGRGEGIAALAVALIEEIPPHAPT
jgi:2-C-methyl-D-erythritol 2,4-cyclodiphosphate synthase